MLIEQDYIINTEEEYRQVHRLKESLFHLHESRIFFKLPLRTLELIRRFNALYIQIFDKHEVTPSNLNQLIITSEGLQNVLFKKN